MQERGVVISAENGVLTVEMQPAEACESCGACAMGALGSRTLDGVLDDIGARPGDTVQIETPLAARRAAQRLVYVVPVMALVGGYLAGFLLSSAQGVANPDSAGAIAALIAGVAALAGLKWRDRSFDSPSARPRVRAIISHGHDGSERHQAAGTGD